MVEQLTIPELEEQNNAENGGRLEAGNQNGTPLENTINMENLQVSLEQHVESESTEVGVEEPSNETPAVDQMEVDQIENEGQLLQGLSWNENTDIHEVAKWHSCKKENYLRGCLFSPDGTCLLTPVNLDGIQVFELPMDLYEKEAVNDQRAVTKLKPAIHIKEGQQSTVYDMDWYPGMNSHMPESCFFIISRQHEPIKCFDAFDGSLRCTYRGYDAVDEVEAALSVCYRTDGAKIFAGYKKTIKIFDTGRPGRDYETLVTKAPTSVLKINVDSSLLAAGSWNSSISIFDIKSRSVSPDILLNGVHRAGVTYLKFLSDTSLVSGARKDSRLVFWDLRNPSAPFFIFNRTVDTNQRIYFDTSPEGKWLMTGDTSGLLRIWNLFDVYADKSAPIKEYSYKLYNDCLNGVSVHPFLPVFATTSGQYTFDDEDVEESTEKCVVENFVTMWWVN